MGRIIKIYEIDEFSEIKTIPDAAISLTILSNIRKLDEKSEMEPFIRQILYDPNETPHGPTEIADILSSHVHIRGDKRLSAFILKGKSFKRISSKEVTHQFAKLRQIPKLGLMVFVAVGNIQDDARRDFEQTANDANCDYTIIDTQDLARLFIAYEKICPKDGTPYDDSGKCRNGHALDEGLHLEMEVKEEIQYQIMNQKDVSHNGAKRYSATIQVDRHYTKDIIRAIIQKATEKLKYSNYYRSEQVKERWGKTPAHVVWLFIAYDLEDIQNANWICQTSWIDSSLAEDMQPSSLNGNEKIGDIGVLWNDDYKSNKNFFKSYYGSKEEVLEVINPILDEMLKLAKQGINYFEEYKHGNISEDKFILNMQKMEPRIEELYSRLPHIPIPPVECEKYVQACYKIFAIIYNIFLFYSKEGLEKRTRENREWLMQDAINRFYDELKNIEIEESKIH
jgi:hypothetical protein